MGININVFNVLLFQLGWFLCVLGGSQVAVFAVPVIILLHLCFINDYPGEWKLLVGVFLIGLLIDSLLLAAGVLVLPEQAIGLPPLWLMLLWPLFATLLNHSLAWFKSHLGLAALSAAIAAPLTYLAGVRLTDTGFFEPQWLALLVIALCWTLAFPLALLLARWSVGGGVAQN